MSKLDSESNRYKEVYVCRRGSLRKLVQSLDVMPMTPPHKVTVTSEQSSFFGVVKTDESLSTQRETD